MKNLLSKDLWLPRLPGIRRFNGILNGKAISDNSTIRVSDSDGTIEVMHTDMEPSPPPQRTLARTLERLHPRLEPTNHHRTAKQQLLVRFADLKNDIISELKAAATSAHHNLLSLPQLSKILHGLRSNELTIFSGPTGTGKTTILSQISIDYAIQDIPVLWGSFEIRNTRLIQVMLQQLAEQPVNMWRVEVDEEGREEMFHDPKVRKAFEEAADQLDSLPIHFMNFFGSTDLHTVLATMEMAVHKLGVQLIVLDNLQFMLSDQSSNSLDKFDLIDRSISALRKFCNQFPVHVFLVIHPRKECDNSQLGISSISGTAKATQEADNVIILQKIFNERFIEVKKNRFNGTLGCLPIAFDPQTRSISVIEEGDGDEKRDEPTNEYRTQPPHRKSSYHQQQQPPPPQNVKYYHGGGRKRE